MRLDPDFNQSGDGLQGVVGMEGREDKVTGQGRFGGDFGRLEVADLADEDDVGILAKNGPQEQPEGKVNVGVDL